MIETVSGLDRFVADSYRKIDLSESYNPYPMQAAFHSSPAQFRLLGGAAGPGKTLALLIEHMVTCNEFSDPAEAAQVHTLLLRRTYPKLEATVVTRFREKIPKELYIDFNESQKIVTWRNGATTRFGSMQHDHNAWDYQGQWLQIDYDEMTEFTFNQWQATAAWNRCPVSPFARKGGATNPIGIGADWVEHLFVLHKPCSEMDQHQARQYNPLDYAYFPCTYLDNPIYANDPVYIANLESYTAGYAKALKEGIWGITGGFFAGAWDEAYNVYEDQDQGDPTYFEIQTWHPKWMGGDWGFEHQAANYWLSIDEHGVVRIYREFVTKHEAPTMLAESLVRENAGDTIQQIHYSHDAFSSRATATHGGNPNSVAMQMNPVLRKAGLPALTQSTRDKHGREMLMYDMLRQRVTVGQRYDDHSDATIPKRVAKLQIARSCVKLIREIGRAPRDEMNREGQERVFSGSILNLIPETLL